MAAIYALLIGINKYPTKPLQGCINDVTAVEDFLRTMYADKPLHIKMLTDEGELPTRENFIKSFDFFHSAITNDVCLIYYSGHGSFSLAPKEFWTETDGYNESFVCIDSRNEGGRDLMDKEMSFLLWKTFKNKPNVSVVVITDCCHSGTITKAFIDNSGITERMMTGNSFPSTLEEYYGFGEKVDGEDGYIFSHDRARVTIRMAKYIHLAASQDNQTAKELSIEGKRRGAFTYSLLKTLYASGGLVSYDELVNKANLSVKMLVNDQSPDININGGLDENEKNKAFLSQENAVLNPKYLVYKDPKFGWCIKAGSLHGLSKGDEVIIEGVCNTEISALPFADSAPVLSKMEMGGQAFHLATVVRKQNHYLTVIFDTNISGGIKNLLEKNFATKPSDYVSYSNDQGQYIIRSDNNHAFMTLPGTDKPIFRPLPVTTVEEGDYFVERIETVSKWNHLLALVNATTRLSSQHFVVKLFRSTQVESYDKDTFEEVDIKELTDFYYKNSEDRWHPPAVRLSFTNLSNIPLWFACAYLQFDFGILGEYFAAVQVGAGKTAWLSTTEGGLEDDVILLQVDDHLQDLGYSQITEYLKVFVSVNKISTGAVSQKGIELSKDKSPGGTKGLEKNDWNAVTIGLRITKPKEILPLNPGQGLEIRGLRIEPHNELQASVSLASSSESLSSIEIVPSPAQAKKNSYLEPFDLFSFTRSDKIMDVLELYEINSTEAVTPKNPLVIVPGATRSLEEENVIPIGYDRQSGLYYPLGYTSANGDIIINTLPEETAVDAAITDRSFIGSIKIYFQKVIGQKLGFRYNYPQLAVATLSKNLEVTYEKDEQKVKEAVSRAQNIILFIHGIIGDTEGMVTCIRTQLEGDNTIEKCYDLILAFDYENLNTKIEITAELLKQKLKAVGLEKEDGKKLTIIAHSMGGLVSRWLVEKLNGHEVVDKLVMLGTPNNGTPWADVRDMAEVLLTYALNGAALLKPWMFVLSGLGKIAGGTQITLKQMDTKTGIYDKLNDGTDPQIPYVIIAGNTQNIIVDYENTVGLIGRFFTRMKKKATYELLDALLFKKPNDIAVSADSIKSVIKADAWKIKPVIHEVACDHLNYFTLVQALQAAKTMFVNK